MTIRDIAIAFGYDVDRQSEKKAEGSIRKLKATATKLLGVIGIGFSLVKINALAEEFGAVNNQIRNATQLLGEQEEVQQVILQAANACRASYAATADIVSNLVQENKDLFPSAKDAAGFAELTTKLFKTAGKSNEEIATLQEAINKSFAKGIVDSETINQLYEKAPEAIGLISDSLGVTSDKLREMAAEGTISLDTLKTAFTSNADLINANFENVSLTVSDAILDIRNKWGLWVADLDKSLGVTQTVGKIMIRAFNAVLDVLKKVQSLIEKLSKAVGGFGNLLKLIATIAGAIWLAMNAKKIIDFIQLVGKGLGAISLKMLAIIALIVAVVLMVEDFIAFMQGRDSVIGSLLEKAGIDTEMARKKIVSVWTAIKEFLTATWGKIKQAATDIWESIKTMLSAAWEFIESAAIAVFSALKAFWDAWGDKIKAVFGTLFRGIGELFANVLDVITDVFRVFAALFSGDWEGLWESVKNLASDIWNAIVTIVATVLGTLRALYGDILTSIWKKAVEVFTNIRTAITDKVTEIKDSIVSGFNAAIDWIKSLPAHALQWGKDIIQGIIDGIKSKIDAVVETVKGIGQTITDFLGFSVPDKGPLADFPNWMPDFMSGLATGIRANIPKVKAALEEVGMNMDVIAGAKTPNAPTVSNITNSASNRSVTQNVNISNTFNGERAAQRNAARSMSKAACDATGEMARGLAYAVR